jgi:dolichol-phosphate mannosyltransferase
MTAPSPSPQKSLETPYTHNSVELAVVLPTFNERENIGEVVARVAEALVGLNWEMIFVDDDSPDGTSEVIRDYAAADRRIRLVHRIGRRGLSSACIEGIMASSANYVAVMDADMQHDESILPDMLRKLRTEALDVVVGTRNADGGSMGQFCASRVFLSRLGLKVSRMISRCEMSDPMSGFFLLKRSFFLEVVHGLHGGGFKILVDMLATSTRPVRLGEVGYCFRNRRHGESKLDVNTALEYLFLVVNKLTDGVVPTRFFLFALVGASGLVVHFACLSMLFCLFHFGFAVSQGWATMAAMTGNFFLNNLITYRDRSLHGIYIVAGLLTFWVACGFGAWANVSFAKTLLHSGVPWYFAGLSGIILSAVWNYSVSNLFTWQMPRSRKPVADEAISQPLRAPVQTL